jgi:hypothetical protein
MPIKNYTATVPANLSISEIQYAFVMQGLDGFLISTSRGQDAWKSYSASDGVKITTLSFLFVYIGRRD